MKANTLVSIVEASKTIERLLGTSDNSQIFEDNLRKILYKKNRGDLLALRVAVKNLKSHTADMIFDSEIVPCKRRP